MGLTAEQLQMAGLIDARVKAIAKSGVDDLPSLPIWLTTCQPSNA